MKKLQSNFTTPEQSKRLLELGVHADSADCYYDSWGQIQWRQLKDLDHDFFQKYNYYTPCWSVGRLIEIILLCPHRRNITISKGYNPIESLINQLVMLREVGTDFSKLEE